MSTRSRFELLALVKEIDEKAEGLTKWEVGFIAGMIDKPPRDFSLRQAEIIERIHEERVKPT